jgi:hypothetical protein
MRLICLCSFVLTRIVVLRVFLFRIGEGLEIRPDTTTRSSPTVTARSIACFALMETMTKRNKKKQEIAIRLLEKNPEFLRMDNRDRAFARLLLSTTERRSGQLDKVIAKFVREPIPDVCERMEVL